MLESIFGVLGSLITGVLLYLLVDKSPWKGWRNLVYGYLRFWLTIQKKTTNNQEEKVVIVGLWLFVSSLSVPTYVWWAIAAAAILWPIAAEDLARRLARNLRGDR